MAELLLKAANYGETLKSVYQSCTKTLLPIIVDYRKGYISSKWAYFKMMVKETYVILLEAGIIQFLEHNIVNFVCPGVGSIIVSIINLLFQAKTIEVIEKNIHEELDKYEAIHAKNVLTPNYKPEQTNNDLYDKVLDDLKLPSDTAPQKALEAILNKKAKLEADPTQSIWEIIKIYKKEVIVRAYCL